jgi:hypothetical protein
MGYFLDKDGNYYEGDNKGGDREVTRRPDRHHTLVNDEWILTSSTEQAIENFSAIKQIEEERLLKEGKVADAIKVKGGL